MAIYNDGAYAYERMRELSPILDTATTETIAQFCADDERNTLAWQELKHYEKHEKFLNVHPLVKQHSTFNEYKQLARTNPRKIINEIANTHKNITRYKSKIKNKQYKSREELVKWEKHIEKAEKLLQMFEILLQR